MKETPKLCFAHKFSWIISRRMVFLQAGPENVQDEKPIDRESLALDVALAGYGTIKVEEMEKLTEIQVKDLDKALKARQGVNIYSFTLMGSKKVRHQEHTNDLIRPNFNDLQAKDFNTALSAFNNSTNKLVEINNIYEGVFAQRPNGKDVKLSGTDLPTLTDGEIAILMAQTSSVSLQWIKNNAGRNKYITQYMNQDVVFPDGSYRKFTVNDAAKYRDLGHTKDTGQIFLELRKMAVDTDKKKTQIAEDAASELVK